MTSIELTSKWAELILNSSYPMSDELKYALIALEAGNPIPDEFNTEWVKSEYEAIFNALQSERDKSQETWFINYILNKVQSNPDLNQRDFDFILDVHAEDVRDLVFTSKTDLKNWLKSSFPKATLEQLEFEDVINAIPDDADHIELSIDLSVVLNWSENWWPNYTDGDFDAEVRIYIAYSEEDGVDLCLPEGSLSDIFKDLTFIKQESPNRSELLLTDFGLLEFEDVDLANYSANFMIEVKKFDMKLYYALQSYNDSKSNVLLVINKNPNRVQFINNYNEDRDVSRLHYYLENNKGYEYVLSIWNDKQGYYEYVREFNAYRSISSMMYQIQWLLDDYDMFSEQKMKNFKGTKKLNIYWTIEKWWFVLWFQLKNEKWEIFLLEEKRNISAEVLYGVMNVIWNTQYSMDSCIEVFLPEDE